MEPVDRSELGIGGEVLDGLHVGVLVPGRQDPPHVAPPEPVTRGVHIAVLVGEAVVDPVVTGPPQGPLLRRGRGPHRHQELGDSAHAVGPVREVPVVTGGDEEHPAHVQTGAQHPVLPGDDDEQRAERGQVGGKERDGRQPGGAVRPIGGSSGVTATGWLEGRGAH